MNKNFSSIRFIIGVAAGKGGVGKSSLTVSLARVMHKAGFAVGVLDADLYGPSLGHMMPLDKPLQKSEEGKFLPGESEGIQVFSLSHIREEELVARAPVINGLLLQAIREISWGELDYLFVDFPPGTGDVQLTVMQNISFSGVVLVTTPGKVCRMDVQKTAQMFHKLNTPIIGVVENMSYFIEPITLQKYFLFGEGGGEKIAHLFGVPFLGKVPLDPDLSRLQDEGKNIFVQKPDGFSAQAIEEICNKVRSHLFEMEELQKDCLNSFELVWQEMQ